MSGNSFPPYRKIRRPQWPSPPCRSLCRLPVSQPFKRDSVFLAHGVVLDAVENRVKTMPFICCREFDALCVVRPFFLQLGQGGHRLKKSHMPVVGTINKSLCKGLFIKLRRAPPIPSRAMILFSSIVLLLRVPSSISQQRHFPRGDQPGDICK